MVDRDGKPQPYDRGFYEAINEGARKSARVLVPRVLDLLSPSSVVDVGCGPGTWLSVFRERGVAKVLGLDGDYVDRALLEIPAECFRAVDLCRPLEGLGRFDLAVSLEVAEHLPPEHAETFVRSLVTLAPAVLFSAAIPHQGGTHHVNEQWQAYWAALFEARGYVTIDCLRRHIWSDPDVEYWYAQNTLLYVSPELLRASPRLEQERRAGGRQLSLVHPKRYEEWVAWGLEQCARADAGGAS